MAELYLVEFKGHRTEFFFNSYYHDLSTADFVIVEVERGEDLGRVKRKISTDIDLSKANRPRSILRRASDEDTARGNTLAKQEQAYKAEVIEIITRHGLPMKVIDVECQFDGNKMTINFTADHRVDFRGLVKDLASRYRTRIELRQIGVRDEARRVGGYGMCGRLQCCSSFIRNFEPISTQHAREQDLPLNPAKISGNCGRLLCCLRYEAEFYTDVKRKFPSPGTCVRTKGGSGIIERIDVFKEEAVIRDQDRMLFRCGCADILPQSSEGREKKPGQHPPKSRSQVDAPAGNKKSNAPNDKASDKNNQ
ncbi:MAG: hypothetical protein KOO62_02470 [candidate division Zixibacteria bacterium]|nr:hypothetical protein [candidate division Zixibacteria bacterium]